jgi:hypothetical protein
LDEAMSARAQHEMWLGIAAVMAAGAMATAPPK